MKLIVLCSFSTSSLSQVSNGKSLSVAQSASSAQLGLMYVQQLQPCALVLSLTFKLLQSGKVIEHDDEDISEASVDPSIFTERYRPTPQASVSASDTSPTGSKLACPTTPPPSSSRLLNLAALKSPVKSELAELLKRQKPSTSRELQPLCEFQVCKPQCNTPNALLSA